jgi:hypothetical protein
VRLLLFHKDFLDNSSRGSFTSRRADDAWRLLDLILIKIKLLPYTMDMIVSRIFTLLIFLEN